jgi:hypothetical protein
VHGGGLLVVPTTTCRLLFVLVILAHETPPNRPSVGNAHPTAAWTVQQLPNPCP